MNRPRGFYWDSRSLLWAAAVLAGSAAFCLLVAWPRMARARELGVQVQSERADMAARYQSLEAIARSEKEATVLTARAANFSERIPSEPQLGGFLEELARLAQKRGLQSDTIQPGEPVRWAEVVALPITIKLHGSFAGVHGLLQDIEHMPRLTRFEQFKVITEEKHPGVVAAEMSLRVFYLPPENGAKTG